MQKREEKKQLILNAATECFSQNGYEKTTLDDIGGKVRLNKATLYYYYNSKDDLFCDVIYSEAQRFRELVRTGTKMRNGIEEKIVFLLYERVKFYEQLGHLQEITLSHGKKIEPIFLTLQQSIFQEERNLLISLLKDAMEKNEVRTSEPGRLADVFLKVSSIETVSKVNGNEKHTFEQNAHHQDPLLEDIRFTTRLILSGMSQLR